LARANTTVTREFASLAGDMRVRPAGGVIERLRADVTLVAASLLFVWLCLLAFVMPMRPDEAGYLIVAHGMLDGQWPYRDLFDNKPPLLYAWYLPVAALGGGIEHQRVLAALMMALSVLPFASIARRWLDPRPARAATISYALLLANPFLNIGANTEAFLLLPLIASIGAPSAVIAGLLFGAAVMTKTSVLLFAPLLLLTWGARSWIVAVAAAAVVAAVSLPFVPIWSDYLEANVWFNRTFTAYRDRRIFELLIFHPLVIAAALPLWALAAIQLFRSPRNPMIACWAVLAVVSVQATGFYFGHYYALAAPPFALLAGIALARINWRSRTRLLVLVPGALSVSLTLAVVAGLAGSRGDGDDLVAAIEATRGELYVLGGDAQFYVQSGRWPERTYFFSIPAVVDEQIAQVMKDDLRACPPDVLVVPEGGRFPIDWHADIEALYTTRQDFETGALFTNPGITCVR
jgi:hypothetical protein